MDNTHLKAVTYAMAKLTRYGNIHEDVIAELWMIPVERWGNDDVTLFRRADEYIEYSGYKGPKPEWLQDDDISGDW